MRCRPCPGTVLRSNRSGRAASCGRREPLKSRHGKQFCGGSAMKLCGRVYGRVLLSGLVALGAAADTPTPTPTRAPPPPRPAPALAPTLAAVSTADLGKGWNIGNTLE